MAAIQWLGDEWRGTAKTSPSYPEASGSENPIFRVPTSLSYFKEVARRLSSPMRSA